MFSKYVKGRKEKKRKKTKNIKVNLHKSLPVHYSVTLNIVHLSSLPQNKDITLLVCYCIALQPDYLGLNLQTEYRHTVAFNV